MTFGIDTIISTRNGISPDSEGNYHVNTWEMELAVAMLDELIEIKKDLTVKDGKIVHKTA